MESANDAHPERDGEKRRLSFLSINHGCITYHLPVGGKKTGILIMSDIPILYCSRWTFSKSLRLKDGFRAVYSYSFDGRYYIGQSKNVSRRHGTHLCNEQYIDRLIRKHGLKPQIIWLGKEDECDDAERRFIREYDSLYPNGYNFETGGCRFKSMSEDTKRKMSESRTGEGHWAYGKHLSEEHRRKLSDAKKGRPTCIVYTEDVRRKISESKKGRKRSQDTVEKCRKAMIGKENHASRKPILQYSIDGAFIREWEGAVEVKRHYGLTHSQYTGINSCLRGRFRVSSGYQWRYKIGDEIPLKIDPIDNNLSIGSTFTDVLR